MDKKIKTRKFDNNEFYEGEVLNNKMHGKGTYTFSDGGKYIGDWHNDMRHGKGIETFPDGYEYNGEYKNDLKHGYGVIKTADGTTYEGNLEEGTMSGEGKLSFTDGSFYKGSFFQGLKNGFGKEVRINDEGNSYTIEGNWFNDFPHGECKVIQSSNIHEVSYYYGENINKNFDGKVEEHVYPNNHVYSGSIVKGLPEGEGSMFFNGGQKYFGSWKEGKPNGFGTLIEGGDVWEGEFKDWDMPRFPIRLYTGQSLLVEGFGDGENYPRLTTWKWTKKNTILDHMLQKTNYSIITEHELEGYWSSQLLLDRLNDNFRKQIEKIHILSMSMSISMDEDNFISALSKYCKENNRKGRFATNIYGKKSIIFDDYDNIKTGFSKFYHENSVEVENYAKKNKD